MTRHPARLVTAALAVAALAGAWAPGGVLPRPAAPARRVDALRDCRAAAVRARFPVACPQAWPRGALPFWADGVGYRACGRGRVTRRRWTWVGAHVRAGGRYGEIVVASAPGELSPRRLVDAFRRVGAVVGWHAPGRTYAVGVSGRLHDRALAARVARSVVLVGAAPSAPRRSRPRTG